MATGFITGAIIIGITGKRLTSVEESWPGSPGQLFCCRKAARLTSRYFEGEADDDV